MKRSRAFIIRVLFLSVALGLAVHAAPTPRPSDGAITISTTTPSADYLNLPAFDLIQAGPSSTHPVRVGDEIHFQIVNGEKGSTLEVPAGEDIHEAGWFLDPKTLQATPLKPGNITLPSLIIRDEAGKAVGRTNPLSLEAASAIQATDQKPQQPEPNQPPVGLPFPFWVVLLITVFILLIFFGIGVGIYRWYKKRKPKLKVVPEVIVAPDEKALGLLRDLESKKYFEKNEFKKHYFALSEILKEYIGSRFRFDALESTTQEMFLVLEQKSAVSDHLLDDLEDSFRQLDRVKFTDHVPGEGEAILLLNQAREFILNTRLAPSVGAVRPGGARDLS